MKKITGKPSKDEKGDLAYVLKNPRFTRTVRVDEDI